MQYPRTSKTESIMVTLEVLFFIFYVSLQGLKDAKDYRQAAASKLVEEMKI